jgi:hypothetical protein
MELGLGINSALLCLRSTQLITNQHISRPRSGVPLLSGAGRERAGISKSLAEKPSIWHL